MMGKLSRTQQLVVESGVSAPKGRGGCGKGLSLVSFHVLVSLWNIQVLLLRVLCHSRRASHHAASVHCLGTILSRGSLYRGHTLDFLTWATCCAGSLS